MYYISNYILKLEKLNERVVKQLVLLHFKKI